MKRYYQAKEEVQIFSWTPEGSLQKEDGEILHKGHVVGRDGVKPIEQDGWYHKIKYCKAGSMAAHGCTSIPRKSK